MIEAEESLRHSGVGDVVRTTLNRINSLQGSLNSDRESSNKNKFLSSFDQA